jgi:anti-sigma regulatory factor (Ser/Thr protein kinase)
VTSSDRPPLPAPLTVEVRRLGDVVVCQRKARAYAGDVGFGVREQWSVAIAVSEAVSNIVKYAGAGVLVLRAVAGEPPALEFEAVDQGGGISDLDAALRDGVSEGRPASGDLAVASRRGLGLGFGTIRRLMHEMHAESSSGGTRVRARLYLGAYGHEPGRSR